MPKHPIQKAMEALSKPLKFKPVKQTEAMLEYAADSLTEAYQIGAEEAQAEMLLRLRRLLPQESPDAP